MTISGPVTGGRHGRPFGGTSLDLDAVGIVEEEYFLSGEATRYRPADGATFDRDGAWNAVAAGEAPFQTRFLVQRPRDPARFNGSVIVSWNNVTAGYELFNGDWEAAFELGFAVVCASVQRVGIVGLDPMKQGMADWDPERYGSLDLPSDDFSFDIFTQIATAVGPDRPAAGAPDPMAGLRVERLIAFGASQSAGRLATYANAIQPLTRRFDAIVLAIYFGTGTALEVGTEVVNIMKPIPNLTSALLVGTHLLRDDGGTKLMVVNSELEAIACQHVRQPASDSYRYWEAAGTCHVSAQSLQVRTERFRRDFGTEPMARNPDAMNRVPMGPVFDAAIARVHDWLTAGVAPPSPPLIDFDANHEVVRDDDGIATGGIRLPQVEVPTGSNGAVPLDETIFGLLDGSTRPFSAATLVERYGDEATFVARFEAAIDHAIANGVVLPRERAPLLAEARMSFREGMGGEAG